MSTDLIPRTFDEAMSVATVFAKSGLFPDTNQAAQAVVKIMAGAELGIRPFAAMSGIVIIKGKVTMSAALMGAVIRNSGRYDWRILEHTDKTCSIQFRTVAGEELGTSTFTWTDAERARLLVSQTWQQYPRNMLFCRAMSNGAKWYCIDVFSNAPYTPDELGNGAAIEDLPENAVVVSAAPVIEAAAAAAPTVNSLWRTCVAHPMWRAKSNARTAALEFLNGKLNESIESYEAITADDVQRLINVMDAELDLDPRDDDPEPDDNDTDGLACHAEPPDDEPDPPAAAPVPPAEPEPAAPAAPANPPAGSTAATTGPTRTELGTALRAHPNWRPMPGPTGPAAFVSGLLGRDVIDTKTLTNDDLRAAIAALDAMPPQVPSVAPAVAAARKSIGTKAQKLAALCAHRLYVEHVPDGDEEAGASFLSSVIGRRIASLADLNIADILGAYGTLDKRILARVKPASEVETPVEPDPAPAAATAAPATPSEPAAAAPRRASTAAAMLAAAPIDHVDTFFAGAPQ